MYFMSFNNGSKANYVCMSVLKENNFHSLFLLFILIFFNSVEIEYKSLNITSLLDCWWHTKKGQKVNNVSKYIEEF